jgi:hypothetical protein
MLYVLSFALACVIFYELLKKWERGFKKYLIYVLIFVLAIILGTIIFALFIIPTYLLFLFSLVRKVYVWRGNAAFK